MVFYRKYRPQTLEELDSASVRERLMQIVASREIPHAFLFTGPKGAGKTSAARIVAKILNCRKLEKAKEKIRNPKSEIRNSLIEPCNICDSCLAITSGTSLDVLEIDAASNRGIEEIRTLRENIRLIPISSAYKVYIIDEVHMLTTEAFNALLKTLEEPPGHASFILATTDAHKVPQTVVSRCVEVIFPRASVADIVRALRRVSQKEHLDIDEEALAFIASQSDGAFRDAVKLLEEGSMAGGQITAQKLGELVGFLPGREERFLSALNTRDGRELLQIISAVANNGMAVRPFTEAILHRLHSEFLATFDPSSSSTSRFTRDELTTLIRLFSQSLRELRSTPIPELPLELAIAEWCGRKEQIAILRQSSGQASKEQRDKESDESTQKKPQSQNSSSSDLWKKIVSMVKEQNHSVAAVLRSCKPLTLAGGTAIIETAYQFHFERLNEPATMALLEQVISDVTGSKVKFQPQLTTKKE